MARNKTLADRSTEMLTIIRALGAGWHSRASIAAQMGKSRMSAADVIVLEALVEQGKLDAEQHEIATNIPIRWEYRIKE